MPFFVYIAVEYVRMKPSSNTKQAILEVLTVLMMIRVFLGMTSCQLAKAVKTPILFSCVLCNFTHFLYSPDQIPMRTIFPRYYTFPDFAVI